MDHREHEPIPPLDTATDPVHSAADLRQRWRALMGPLGFGQRLLWIGFVDADRRLMKTLSQLPIRPRPQAAVLKDLMSVLRTVLDGLEPISTVALLMTGPGQGPVTPADRLWCKSLTAAAERFAVPLEPVFRANDEALVQVEPA